MWSPVIAEQLRRRGNDVVASAARAELRGLSDDDILRAAALERRAVATRDVGDFSLLIERWRAEGRDHWGVVLVSPRRYPASKAGIGPLVRALDAILKGRPREADLMNARVWLA